MTGASERDDYGRIRELAVDAVPSAMVVVHNSGAVAMVNAAARRLLGLSSRDVGRPFQDLEISYRPMEFRSAIDQVQKEQRPLIFEEIAWGEDPQSVDYFDIHVVPLSEPCGPCLAVAITFIDVTLPRRLQEELEVTNRDLESAVEQLQLTIEELETMNAELQSTNEELQAINEESALRARELDATNEFLESMLLSREGSLVVLDGDLRISVWNEQSAELWGLRTDEAPGQHFLNIDIGLPVDELREPLKAILAADSERETVELDATNRRGRDFRCRVTMTPLVNRDHQARGVILDIEDVSGERR